MKLHHPLSSVSSPAATICKLAAPSSTSRLLQRHLRASVASASCSKQRRDLFKMDVCNFSLALTAIQLHLKVEPTIRRRRSEADTTVDLCFFSLHFWFLRQAERVSSGGGSSVGGRGTLLVTKISCWTVTGDAGTLARCACPASRHKSSAASSPFPRAAAETRPEEAAPRAAEPASLKITSRSCQHLCFLPICTFQHVPVGS